MLTILDPPNVAARTADTTDADNGFRTLAAGEMLFREGEARSHVYRVEKGSICLFKQRADGSQDVIEFAFPGDLVGLGYLDNHVSGAQATMETSLRCLPRSALDPALEKSPAITSRLTAAIEREVAFLKQTYARSQRSEPLERVAALFVTLSRCNAYEGRDPSLITELVELWRRRRLPQHEPRRSRALSDGVGSAEPRRGFGAGSATKESRRVGAARRRWRLSSMHASIIDAIDGWRFFHARINE